MDRFPLDAPQPMPIRGIRSPGGLPWIPWRWIRKRYSPGAWRELTHLFNAYNLIHSEMDIEGIGAKLPPPNLENPCRRCGQCCAQLTPDPVPVEKFHEWTRTGNLLYLFHHPVTEGPRVGKFYTGWYHNGARLRMCPLLLRDPESGTNFCALYHLGPGHRPPACEGYKPNWPHCEVSQRPLVP